MGAVWALAVAEMRLIRRLVRYWVFVVISFLASVAAFLQYWGVHAFFSGESATAAAMNPRYLISFIGSVFLLIFLFGLVFLSFDIRARDQRERIHEALDARPFTNLELVAGRSLGILLVCWIPVVVTSIVLWILGLALKSPIEPRSLVIFVVFMTIPGLVLTMGLVYVVTLLARNRLVSSVVMIGLLALLFFGSRRVPMYYLPLIDLTGGYSVPFPSDLHGSMIDLSGLTHRLACLIAGCGLIVLAAALYPRPDDGSRKLQGAIGGGLIAIGAGLLLFQFFELKSNLSLHASWRAAHSARDDEPVQDLQKISGEIVIEPGEGIELDLTLTFTAPERTALDHALFTLNPGFEIESVTANGARAEYRFADGLLEIDLPARLEPGATAELTLAASGMPDGRFGYLDAAVDAWRLTPNEAAIFMLGYEGVIADGEFVALLPGSRWLPASGPETGREHPDFHDVDLTVELPLGWLVAGPGRREPAGGNGNVRFRFAPGAPVPEVALVASRFESVSTEVEGVELELLVHPSHRANVELFEDAGAEIREWLASSLREARAMGLDYPYGALTLVEVPVSLRGYGGGWRMDTTFAQPAMILLRESSFPTAKFARYFNESQQKRLAEQEGGVARAKRQRLETFFEADLSGGNPFLAASRSFFLFQTAGTGREALPLDYVWETLATRLLTDKQGYFSVHLFDERIGQRIGEASMQMADPDRIRGSYTEVMAAMVSSSPKTWERLLEVSLADVDPWADPEQTIAMLELKGRAMADSLLDYLGRERAGRFLGTLRERARGSAYTREDVLAAGQAVGEDLGVWLDYWIDQTDLPGFVAAGVQSHRLVPPAEERGAPPRYQTVFTIANEQDCPGLLRVDWVVGEDKEREEGSTDPIYVPGSSAVEVGIVTGKPPRSLNVVPYLALNRGPFGVTVPPVDEEKPVVAEPFAGARPVSWAPLDDGFIIVDDLDDGFRVEDAAERGWLRLMGSSGKKELDSGLPANDVEVDGTPSRWSRRAVSWAWGRYRHTHALVRSGKGDGRAIFAADLPRAGAWELDFYLPKRFVDDAQRNPTGTWKLAVEHANGSEPVSFDAKVAQPGWNTLGRFEVPAGEVRVSLTNETDGRWVAADAIRWKPADAEVARK